MKKSNYHFKRMVINQPIKRLSLILFVGLALTFSCKKDKKDKIDEEIIPASTLVVSTFAGTGVADADFQDGSSATFNMPSGIAVDKDGYLYIADTNHHRIRKITPGGVVSTLAGDGIADFKDKLTLQSEAARFNAPTGVAVDQNFNVYVADKDNQRIRKITPTGLVSTLAGDGIADFKDKPAGQQETARFNSPRGVAVDVNGNVYVADTGNSRIRKIVTAIFPSVSTLAGTGDPAIIDKPWGVTVAKDGTVYVADTNNHRILKITTGAGNDVTISALAGAIKGFKDDKGGDARFDFPTSIALDKDGYLYVADRNNHRIRKISPEAGVVSTLAGSGTLDANNLFIGAFLDGKATEARFNLPSGVVIAADGKLYVADRDNYRIRKIE
ncbi:MAG: NHL repeat-containing protein [Daejeonella sp.]